MADKIFLVGYTLPVIGIDELTRVAITTYSAESSDYPELSEPEPETDDARTD